MAIHHADSKANQGGIIALTDSEPPNSPIPEEKPLVPVPSALSDQAEEHGERKFSKKLKVFAAGGLGIGLFLGGVFGAGLLNSQVSDLKDEVVQLKRLLDEETAAKEEAQVLATTAEELALERAKREVQPILDEMKKLDAELNEREKAVSEHEERLDAAQKERDANSFGAGIRIVGTNISAGTYTSNVTGGNCYYAWKTDTGSRADIIDNNLVQSGPVIVTLADGEVFENSGCGTWVKQ